MKLNSVPIPDERHGEFQCFENARCGQNFRNDINTKLTIAVVPADDGKFLCLTSHPKLNGFSMELEGDNLPGCQIEFPSRTVAAADDQSIAIRPPREFFNA